MSTESTGSSTTTDITELDINKLNYPFYKRFIELLPRELVSKFSSTNKKNYIECIKTRGLPVRVKHYGSKKVDIDRYGVLNIFVKNKYEYMMIMDDLSKFKPYLKFIEFTILFLKLARVDILPIPREYEIINVFLPRNLNDVDFLCNNYYHDGLKRVCFKLEYFRNIDDMFRMMNYIVNKMPVVDSFTFCVILRKNEALEYINLIKPPRNGMTINVTYAEDINNYYALLYQNNEWNDYIYPVD